LVELGVVQAYIRLKFRETRATLNLLYALWGAVEGVKFNEIPQNVRESLRQEVEMLLDLTD
jgi:hypothetical protein